MDVHFINNNKILTLTFHSLGYTGEVNLDNLGNRIPFFQVTNYQNTTPVIITYYNPLKEFYIAKDKIIIFPGKTKIRPLDEPICGFNEEKCPKRKFQFPIKVIQLLHIPELPNLSKLLKFE